MDEQGTEGGYISKVRGDRSAGLLGLDKRLAENSVCVAPGEETQSLLAWPPSLSSDFTSVHLPLPSAAAYVSGAAGGC